MDIDGDFQQTWWYICAHQSIYIDCRPINPLAYWKPTETNPWGPFLQQQWWIYSDFANPNRDFICSDVEFSPRTGENPLRVNWLVESENQSHWSSEPK